VRLVGGIEDYLAIVQDGLGFPKVDHSRGEKSDTGMTMLVVVPVEKLLTEGAAVLNAAEAIRKLGTVLQSAELAFRVRVVVGNIRPTMSLGDTQVGHQKGHRLGRHHPAAVGVDVELAGRNLVLADGFLNELPGQFSALARRDHPADDVAAEDIQDDIQIEVGPLGRTE